MISLGPYSALRWPFRVECDSPLLAQHLSRVFSSLADAGAAAGAGEHVYQLSKPRRSSGQLRLDGAVLHASWDTRELIGRLLWHLNVSATEASSDYVLLHAAAAEQSGRAVVLCAPMEAGKTTLVAALVMAGLRYLTDEAVALDPDDLQIAPYAKAMSIDPGSWDVLAPLRPVPVAAGAEHLMDQQWQVSPTSIRADALSTGARPAVVVLPRYCPGEATSFVEIRPGEALLELLQQTFHLDRQRRRDMQVLARVVESSACYRLRSGNLDQARDAVLDALNA